MKTKKTGVDPVYDQQFLNLKNESIFLSPREQNLGMGTMFWDKQTLSNEVVKYKGNAKGEYVENTTAKQSLIPSVLNKLKSLDLEFKEYQKDQENQGFDVPEMLPEMLERKSRLEAERDIFYEELAKIENKLKNYVEEVDHSSDALVLKYGLMQEVWLNDNVIREIDGQKVTKTEEGILIINDTRSPYSGMLVASYRKLAKQWCEDILKKDAEYLAKIQEEAKAAGKDLPQAFTSLGGGIPKSELPVWPEGVKNYLTDDYSKRTK
jgi:hypothetical protein